MLKKALTNRSTEKALKEMLKEALRKVIFLKEVLKIVFLLKKVFPKNMVLESNKILKKFTNTLKKVLKKALQKAFKVKSSQKSAKKKYSEKLFGSRIGSKKSRLTKKTLNKVFLVKKVLIKGKAQKSIPSGEIDWKYILKRYVTDRRQE